MSDWFSQAVADVGNALNDAGTAIVNAVEAVGEKVEDAAQAVGTAIANAVEAAGDKIADTAEAVGDAIDNAFNDAGQAINSAGASVLNALDDYVFDPVDYITGGAIDVDYDDGQFTADLDFGIASVGVSIGDQGFSAEAGFDIGIASGEMSYDSAGGFAASGSIGVAWGPLPYAEGHIDVSPNGDISIGGHLQGTLPLPGGSIGGELDGGLYRNADGSWGASGSVAVDVDGPMGTGAHFGTDMSVGGDGAGSLNFDAGFDLSATGPGGTGASLSTDTSLGVGRGGIEFDTSLDVSVNGPGGTGASLSTDTSLGVGRGGVEFDAGLDASVTGPGGTHVGVSTDAGFTTGIDAQGNLTTTVDASVDVDVNGRDLHASGEVSQTGFDLPVLTDVNISVSAPDPVSPDPTAAAMSALAGSGDLAEVLSGAGGDLDDAASALFGGQILDPSQAIDAAGAMVESGAFDALTSGVVSADILEADADQMWDNLGP